MSVFSRLKTIIEADLHEWLDEKEKKNPIALLNHYLRQCEQEVERVRQLLERQYALKEQFARERREAEQMAEKRSKQAEVAAQAGEVELAEFARREQAQYAERATRLKQLSEQASRELFELEAKYEEMKHKLKDMQMRRMELMGRENAARAHYRIHRVVNGDAGPALAAFADAEVYLDRLEQQVRSDYYRSTIDARIAQLEKQLQEGN
ncbi:modulator protein [Geobacillus genomosp. 3]|uniref:Modulator protein n=1 Tax=Geobacillus genomosp. 3 TaxID=1921421 RepID=S5YVZ8_GEOG3|nr:PspA/IM30 family protein [Geobacillus genomosp. 3]AGT30844.2 modulator protein [Geobacillus genomosp. 3]